MNLNKNVAAAVVGFGVAVASAVANPQVIPVVGAAAGGALTATGLVQERKNKQKDFELKTAKVSKALSYCYEHFKGLVSPQQLAFHAEIELEQAEKFLETLISSQNQGQRIDTPVGVVYSFDHPEQVLNQLSQNAMAWADSQTEELIRENSTLKRQVQLMSAAAQSQVIGAKAPNLSADLFNQNNLVPPGVADPWKNML